MIPSRYQYYRRRAAEHRCLADRAQESEARARHERLVEAYARLARDWRLHGGVRLTVRVGGDEPADLRA